MSKPTPGPFGAHACGCTVDRLGDFVQIVNCDMHRSAPELLKACKAALKSLMNPELGQRDTLKLLRDAIAKAEGK